MAGRCRRLQGAPAQASYARGLELPKIICSVFKKLPMPSRVLHIDGRLAGCSCPADPHVSCLDKAVRFGSRAASGWLVNKILCVATLPTATDGQGVPPHCCSGRRGGRECQLAAVAERSQLPVQVGLRGLGADLGVGKARQWRRTKCIYTVLLSAPPLPYFTASLCCLIECASPCHRPAAAASRAGDAQHHCDTILPCPTASSPPFLLFTAASGRSRWRASGPAAGAAPPAAPAQASPGGV